MQLNHFEDIYREYQHLVYNIALAYVQNVEDAEEITQDVFVSVHEALGTFRKDAKISTWIYRIAINKSLDFIKSKKRKKRFAILISVFRGDDSSISEHTEFNHPGVQLEQKEEMAFIFKCLNDLPVQQRTAIILAKLENKTQAEVAMIMNTSIKAVESLIQRGKRNLEEKISKSEGFENFRRLNKS